MLPIGSKLGVLVVDDEAGIRALLQRALQWYGFEVWVAADGSEALGVYDRLRDAIAVVLLDVRMPGLDGPQTLAALQHLNPDIRCCFMTGDTGGYSTEDLLGHGAAHVLAKPFRLERVVDLLRQVIGVPACPSWPEGQRGQSMTSGTVPRSQGALENSAP